MTSIGLNCFTGLKGLKTIYVPSTLESFKSQTCMGRETTSQNSITEIVVYGEGATGVPSALSKIVADDASASAKSIKCVTLPAKVLADIDALGSATAADLATVVEVQQEYSALSDAAKKAPGYTDETWAAAEKTIEAAVNRIWADAFSNTSTLTADQKLALVNSMISYKQDELDQAQAAKAQAEADRDKYAEMYSEAQRKWIAASETATSVNSMKANYERQLKEAQAKMEEAQAKVDEAQAKVAELEKQLDSDQSAAEAAAAKAEVVSLQDQLAVRSYAASTKTVKLNKRGRTKAKSVVRLKLVKSASGAAVSCAKAKGTSKKVTVSDTGVVTLKKGVRKGAYKAVVTFTCGKATNTVTVTFKAA